MAWAKSVGEARLKNLQNGGGGKTPLLFPLANALLKKVRGAIGLDQCYVMLTGAAPINKDVLEYFGRLNMPVLELYGMSESSGPQTVSYIQPGMVERVICLVSGSFNICGIVINTK